MVGKGLCECGIDGCGVGLRIIGDSDSDCDELNATIHSFVPRRCGSHLLLARNNERTLIDPL